MRLQAEIESMGQRAVDLAREALEGGLLTGRPQQLLFLSISGAHIYGFPSPDSDLDLRGTHLLPLEQVVGLAPLDETYELTAGEVRGIELDCVTHDLGKYLRLLTRKNGYILEQILSPLMVYDSGCLEELRRLALGALTRHVVHHYKGFFRNRMKLAMDGQTAVKNVLYLFRVAMSGLFLLRTRRVETNLLGLNEAMFKLPFLEELVQRKVEGREKGLLPEDERQHLLAEAERLAGQLDAAAEASGLPDHPPNLDDINDFLVRTRFSPRHSAPYSRNSDDRR